ncbi:MAG: type 1 glutamine amidotransferase domain-containing protein [Rhodospirillaceae bacterium]
MGTLDGMRVAILVTDNFEQVELTGPREALDGEGAVCTIVSNKPGRVQGVNHFDKGEQFDVGALLDDARAADFDALLLPGGVMNADQLRVLPKAQDFVRTLAQDGKPIAVICHGAWLLVSAGLVAGRTLTSWPTLQDDLRNAGARWVDEEVVLDGNWVSSRRPSDIPAFNREMLALFSEHTAAFRRSIRRGEPRELPGGLVTDNPGTESDTTTRQS